MWLDMAVDDIVARLSKDASEIAKRPLLQGGDAADKLAAIYEERKPMYEQVRVCVLYTTIQYTIVMNKHLLLSAHRVVSDIMRCTLDANVKAFTAVVSVTHHSMPVTVLKARHIP